MLLLAYWEIHFFFLTECIPFNIFTASSLEIAFSNASKLLSSTSKFGVPPKQADLVKLIEKE